MRKKASHDSFIGEDGMRYVWVGDDLGYMRENPRDDDSRRYYESHSLKIKMLKEIEGSGMKDFAKAFSAFAVKSTYLEQILNEYYDAAAIICMHDNPMVTMKDATDDTKKIWSHKNGDTKKFSKLSVGQKHQVLQLFQFITDEDKRKYKKYLAKLDMYVGLRNEIIHSFFGHTKVTSDKEKDIKNATKLCDEVCEFLNNLDSVFRFYILNNVATYYDLDGEDIQVGEER